MRRYARLAVLPPRDQPGAYPTSIKNYQPPTSRPNERPDPARFSTDQFVRWCNACDTVLPARGQSPFCDPCRTKYTSLQRQRKRWLERGTVDVGRRHLLTLFEYADGLDRDLGILTRVYNTNPRDLESQMDTVMRSSKKLISHLQRHIPNPTPPGG